MQEFARHADPRTTIRYDRARHCLDATPPTPSCNTSRAPHDPFEPTVGRPAETLVARMSPHLAYASVYTPSMSKTVPSREFRSHLAELLDEVADRREHVTVTRRGRPAAVLVPIDEYEALEETAEILSDDDTLAAIRRGLDDLACEDLVSLDQVRDEHAGRGSS